MAYVKRIPINGSLAYKIMEKAKEEYNKKDKIQGIHFIQSFRPEENITPQIAHEVGRKWVDKLLNSYEYLLYTHKDDGYIHIIINSISFETGKKYLKNDRELREIRKILMKSVENMDWILLNQRKKTEVNPIKNGNYTKKIYPGKTLGEDYTEENIKDRIKEFKKSKLI